MKMNSLVDTMDISEEHLTYDPVDMEDEDVYLEKNQVHLYLQEATEFTGSYEVFEDRGKQCEGETIVPPKRSCSILPWLFYKSNEQALNDQVAKILLCGLVVDEHHQYLEKLYVGHQRRAQFLLKETICPSKVLIFCSGIASAALSSTLYCLNKGRMWKHLLYLLPMAVPIATLAFWRAYERHKRQSDAKRTSQLIAALDTLFLTLRKSVKLVQENEMIAHGHMLARGGVTNKHFSAGSKLPDYATNLKLMPSLRGAIFENTKDAIEVLFQTREEMASVVPLSNVATNDNELRVEYEKILTEDRFSLTTIKCLQNLFVLTQSEVMLRLALSLCPSFWLNPKSSNIEDVYRAISSATDKLNCLESNMNLEYQIFYSFGLKPGEKQTAPTSRVSTVPSLKLIDVYTGVHTGVLRLQAMLFESRAVEKSIESYLCVGDEDQDQLFLEHLENNLSQTTTQIDALLSCFNVALAEVNKLKRRPAHVDPITVPTFSEQGIESAVVEQEEYVVEDEVYELYCKKTDSSENEGEHETVSLSNDEKAEKEMGERSAIMVKELKTALKGKAEEWKMREAVALRKRGNTDDHEGAFVDEESASVMENELLGHAEETPLVKVMDAKSFPVTRGAEDIFSTERWVDENGAKKISWAISESALRFRLPVSQVEEEFCCSGDESEDGDDTAE